MSPSLLQLKRPRSEWSNALKLLVWYALKEEERRGEKNLRLHTVCVLCACGVRCAECVWCYVLIQVVYILLLSIFPSLLSQVLKDSPLDQRCGGEESRREMENVS